MADVASSSSIPVLAEDDCERLAQSFERSCGPDGFVDAAESQRLLRRTGLQEQLLETIWDLSDLDRDGRLSLREFICAMTLADQAKNGQPLPVELHPEQQTSLAARVELLVKSRPQKEEFSTVETSASFRGPPAGLFTETERSLPQASPLRGRDSTPRPLPMLGEGQDRMETTKMPETLPKLGQLATVLKLVSRAGPGELQKLCEEVLQERQRLESQLGRRRELEEALRAAKGRLDEVQERHRSMEAQSAATKRRISYLQDELVFVTREVKTVEEDLDALRQACGLGDKEMRRMPVPYSDLQEERRDVLTKVKAERELLLKDQKEVEELRGKLERVFQQKLEAQMKQQALLEKQRQCEQDRGLVLTAIEADKAKLLSMRSERLRSWQDIADLEKQLQDVDQERLLVSRQVVGRNVPSTSRSTEVPNRRKGVPHESSPSVVYGGSPAGGAVATMGSVPGGRSEARSNWRVAPDPVRFNSAMEAPMAHLSGPAPPGARFSQAMPNSGYTRHDGRGIRADS
ncbi:Itsn1 [Symbiodinium pilosum]|uniref:Itsn1 protein n=1 Tax=Symbiodinium pilosum TaxID=2952 RepID=A0A812MKS2_SYMPI|nr:Itsn1 [Symbiodinium pilosum]